MKKLVCIIFALILFNACQKKEPQRYFSESAEIETSKKLLSYFATYNYDGIKEIYSDSAKIYDNSVKATSLSDMITMMKDNQQMAEYMKIKDSAEYEMVVTKDNETWVNCWYAIAGKFKGLDKEFVIPCHSTFQFKNGKIIEEYSYYNTQSVYQEMEKLSDTTAVDTMATK